MRRIILCLILAVPFALAAEEAGKLEPLRQGAALYTSKDYTGASQIFSTDATNLTSTKVGDDRTTSVRVAPGCRVRLFENPGFKGAYLELAQDTPTLKGQAVSVNQASSLQVRCGRVPFPDELEASRATAKSDPSSVQRSDGAVATTQAESAQSGGSPASATPALPETGVTLYTERGYKGTSRNVRNAVPDLSATEVGSNRAQSIQVASGCYVDLYAGKAFSGETTRLYRSAVNLGPFENRVSSLNAVCGQPGAAPATSGVGTGSGSGAEPGVAAGAAAASASQPPKSGVRVFDSRDYQGKSQVFTQDMPDLSRSRIGDGVARSVLVSEGCTAELYDEPNYRGNRAFLDSSAATLVNTPIGNRALSSLRIQCAVDACPGGSGMDHCVTLYAESDWKGQSESFDADVADLRRTNIGDRRARSLRVSDGCAGVLYSQPDFHGDAQEFGRDEARLDRTGFGADRASSVRFYCGDAPGAGATVGGGVTLFEHRDFAGRSQKFTADVIDLQGTQIGVDQASSVKVDPGCRAWLYDETEFYGNYSVIERDEPALRDLTVGSDRVRSLRVDCGAGSGSGGSAQGSSPSGGGEVTLYQHAGFLGRSETFRGDVRDLHGTQIGEREASSIRVSSGCTATLYSDPDFGGRSSDFNGDTGTFFFAEIGDDRASSLKLRCN
jgi:hypothetical protein